MVQLSQRQARGSLRYTVTLMLVVANVGNSLMI